MQDDICRLSFFDCFAVGGGHVPTCWLLVRIHKAEHREGSSRHRCFSLCKSSKLGMPECIQDNSIKRGLSLEAASCLLDMVSLCVLLVLVTAMTTQVRQARAGFRRIAEAATVHQRSVRSPQ